jgi:hypothetical protein
MGKETADDDRIGGDRMVASILSTLGLIIIIAVVIVALIIGIFVRAVRGRPGPPR